MKDEIAIPDLPSPRIKPPVRHAWLKRHFIVEKLNSPLGYTMLFILMAVIGVGIARGGMIFGILTLAGFLAIPVLYILIFYPLVGIVFFLTAAYFIMLLLRLGVNFPLGAIMDGMEGVFILNLFIQQKRKPDWKIFKGPITVMMLVWIVYNFMEAANPVAASQLVWVYTVRSVAVVMGMYFIFVYNIRTKAFIRLILKLWLALALIGALYAAKQQHWGFAQFELNYLHSDPNIELLLYIAGEWRKFSIFSDPVVFSYTMAVSTLLCVGLMTGPIAFYKKIILLALICTYVTTMLYSGTRGAYVLIPASMILFVILKFSRKMMPYVVGAGLVLVVLIFMPTSNATLYRFQTAFKPAKDASFNVRKMNQKRIQPYIQTHPIGGGLGATGEWGQRFAPMSYLANFPPDSGYVRVAVEEGWIGLLLLCTLMFTILKTGIDNFYAIKDPELKAYCLAMVLVAFAFNIGNYPQEALVQYPSNVYFYLVTALIVVLKRIDNEQNQLQDANG